MNLLKSAGQVLATMAPTIATAVGGPFAGMAVTQLEALFGIDPTTPQDAKQAAIEQGLLTATPDQLLALKKLEQDFALQMEQLGITRDQLAYADTANARAREIALKDMTPRIIAYGVIGATFFLEGYLIIRGMPNMDAQMAIVVGRVLGTFDTATALILSYYFGSSAGSASKTDAINSIAVQKAAK